MLQDASTLLSKILVCKKNRKGCDLGSSLYARRPRGFLDKGQGKDIVCKPLYLSSAFVESHGDRSVTKDTSNPRGIKEVIVCASESIVLVENNQET